MTTFKNLSGLFLNARYLLNSRFQTGSDRDKRLLKVLLILGFFKERMLQQLRGARTLACFLQQAVDDHFPKRLAICLKAKLIPLFFSAKKYVGTTSPCTDLFLRRQYPDWADRFEASTLKLSLEGTCDREPFPTPFLWRLCQTTRCLLWNHNRDPKMQPIEYIHQDHFEAFTCSITSGAIQHGVPTNVCLTFCLDKSLPVANQADTPKSAIWTVPSSPRRMFPAFTSLKLDIVLMDIQFTAAVSFSQTCVFVRCYENIPGPSKPHAEQ